MFSITLEHTNDTFAYTESETPDYEWNNILGLCLAIGDDADSDGFDDVYIMGLKVTVQEVKDETTGKWVETRTYSDTAHLWKYGAKGTGFNQVIGFFDKGDTGMEMDYLQSMTWDHNTESLYWAHFYPVNLFTLKSELIKVDVDNPAASTLVGTLSNETCALIAPLNAETQATHTTVPNFDPAAAAAPVLKQERVTLGKGKSTTLVCMIDPWYVTDPTVTWSSSDPTVATVDEIGTVTAVSDGNCTITVTSNQSGRTDTCDVTVISLTLNVKGVISMSAGGVGSYGNSSLYTYNMVEGVAELAIGNRITTPPEFANNSTSAMSSFSPRKRSIWNRFAPGRFARSIPNAIGTRRRGSNFFAIAR